MRLPDKSGKTPLKNIRKNILMRLVLPITFSEGYDDWLEDKDASSQGRGKHLEQLLTERIGPRGPTEEGAGEPEITDETLASVAVYHRLVRKLLRASEGSPEPDWQLDKDLDEKQRDVLLPQVISTLLTRSRDKLLGFEDITVLKLSGSKAREWNQGGLLALKRNTSRKPYYALLEQIRLTLCSTGIGLLEIDLHPINPEGTLSEPNTKRFFDALAPITSLCHRAEDNSTDQCVAFETDWLDILLRNEPGYQDLATALFRYFKQQVSPRLFPQAEKDQAIADKRRVAAALQAFYAELRDEPSPPKKEHESQEAWKERKKLAQDLRNEQRQTFVARLRSRLGAKDQDAASPSAAKTLLEEKLKEAGLSEPGDVAEDVLKAFNSVVRDLDDSATRSCWQPQDMTRWLFRDQLGMPEAVEAESDNRHILSGDRFFVFSHINTATPSCEYLKQEQVQRAVARVARHTDKNSPDLVTGSDATFSGGCFVTSLRFTSTSLEGCAVLVTGDGKDNYDPTEGIRIRQFMLVRLGLLYRYSLLNLSFAGDDLRGKKGNKAIDRIDLLCRAVDEFGHRLYHGHISNFSHLQAFFDVVLKAFNVERLWNDLEKDLPRILERRTLLIEKQAATRRDKVAFVATVFGVPLTALFLLKEFYELADRLDLGLPDPKGAQGWLFLAGFGLGTLILGYGVNKAVEWWVQRNKT